MAGYAVLGFVASCPAHIDTLIVDYRLLFDVDTQHRGLLNIESAGVTSASVFSPQTSRQELRLASQSRATQFQAYLRTGVEHIFTGFDHQLFLLCLLLPCVYRRQQSEWRAVPPSCRHLWM
jgi:hypothetical protein